MEEESTSVVRDEARSWVGQSRSGTLGRLDISRGRILVPFDGSTRGLRKPVPRGVGHSGVTTAETSLGDHAHVGPRSVDCEMAAPRAVGRESGSGRECRNVTWVPGSVQEGPLRGKVRCQWYATQLQPPQHTLGLCQTVRSHPFRSSLDRGRLV